MYHLCEYLSADMHTACDRKVVSFPITPGLCYTMDIFFNTLTWIAFDEDVIWSRLSSQSQPVYHFPSINVCWLGCFSKDTLKENKKPNPVCNWREPRENISRRRGWSDKCRGSPKALELRKKFTQNRRRRRNIPILNVLSFNAYRVSF